MPRSSRDAARRADDSWKAAIRPDFHLFKLNGVVVTSAAQALAELRIGATVSTRAILEFIDHHGYTRRPVRCSVEYASAVDVARVSASVPRRSGFAAHPSLHAAELRLHLCLAIGRWQQRRVTRPVPLAADNTQRTIDMSWVGPGGCWEPPREETHGSERPNERQPQRQGRTVRQEELPLHFMCGTTGTVHANPSHTLNFLITYGCTVLVPYLVHSPADESRDTRVCERAAGLRDISNPAPSFADARRRRGGSSSGATGGGG